MIISINYGFKTLDIDSITIVTFNDNEGIKKIIEKFRIKSIWNPKKEYNNIRY